MLAEVAHRHTVARAALLKNGLDRGFLADAIAPRFIRSEHWEKVRASVQYRPEPVYGATEWHAYQRSVERVDQAAAWNRMVGAIRPLSRETLFQWNTELGTVQGDPNRFRDSGELGISFNRSQAITRAELAAIESTRFRRGVETIPRPLIDWVATPCIDLWSGAEKRAAYRGAILNSAAIPRLADVNEFFLASDGLDRQCGYYHYPPAAEVSGLVDQWLAETNAGIRAWNTNRSAIDLVRLAAQTQRGIVMIHPFGDGNGRLSRYAMDYILESTGLPPPIIPDMNLDFSSNDAEWAATIARGIVRTVEIEEACVRTPTAPGCRMIPPLTAPGESMK